MLREQFIKKLFVKNCKILIFSPKTPLSFRKSCVLRIVISVPHQMYMCVLKSRNPFVYKVFRDFLYLPLFKIRAHLGKNFFKKRNCCNIFHFFLLII